MNVKLPTRMSLSILGLRRRQTIAAALLALTATGALGLAPGAAQAKQAAFPQDARALAGWQTESIPAYQCPRDYPYLSKQNYAPWGTLMIPGVEIREATDPWSIGISIPSANAGPQADAHSYWPVGISGSTTLGQRTSATNWDPFHSHKYQVILHCTDDKSASYTVDHAGSGWDDPDRA